MSLKRMDGPNLSVCKITTIFAIAKRRERCSPPAKNPALGNGIPQINSDLQVSFLGLLLPEVFLPNPTARLH
jgi:hypothetical protein